MWSFVAALASLIVLLFQEFFSARARARQADKEFQIDQKSFHDMVSAAVQRQQANAAKDSAGAGNAWDAADQDLQSRPPRAPGE